MNNFEIARAEVNAMTMLLFSPYNIAQGFVCMRKDLRYELNFCFMLIAVNSLQWKLTENDLSVHSTLSILKII